MAGKFSRRQILGAVRSREEEILLEWLRQEAPAPSPAAPPRPLPRGKIGKLEISRLIVGGNLTSGNAHSRDLIYLSPLLKRYFTDEKVLETWVLCEECGINTGILRLDDQTVRLINAHRKRGGRMQWLMQIKPPAASLEAFQQDLQRALDNGVMGAYVQGSMADALVQDGRVGLVGEFLQAIRDKGVPAGIGAHCLEVPAACEREGIRPDFYMKTLHPRDYWSFNPRGEVWKPFHPISRASGDNVWCTNPEETIAFMNTCPVPWIAFKVLAAGAVHPRDGFRFAFENGADFVCAGIFDFQVREDAALAAEILSNLPPRRRPWRG